MLYLSALLFSASLLLPPPQLPTTNQQPGHQLCMAGTVLGALQGVGCQHVLASCGLRRSAGVICVAGAGLGALQGVGCTPWRPVGSPRSAWCCPRGWTRARASCAAPLCRCDLCGRRSAWCSPRVTIYALASYRLELLGRRSAWCSPKLDARPSVLWAPPL